MDVTQANGASVYFSLYCIVKHNLYVGLGILRNHDIIVVLLFGFDIMRVCTRQTSILYICMEMLVVMLAVGRCGKNRPHALFAFDAMLLTAGELQIVIRPSDECS